MHFIIKKSMARICYGVTHMIIILAVVLILAGIVYLMFAEPVRLFFLLDSDKMELHFSAAWLSLLYVQAEIIHSKAYISVYLLRKKIASKFLSKRRNTHSAVFSALSLKDTRIRTFYGMAAPHVTGILCGVIGFLGSFVEAECFEQFAEFVPEHEYLQIQGSSRLNLGKTIVNAMQLRSKK